VIVSTLSFWRRSIWVSYFFPVALAHLPTENVTRTGRLLDSNLSHADEWPSVAKKLRRTTEDEYFSVPRGRVLLDVDSLTGIILHGPATSRKRLESIARRFGLGAWRAELDQHYFTGQDADRLFDEGVVRL
jgi:hypothetical protein